MSYQADLRARITNQIIESLKAGTAPWKRPWTSSGPSLPTNIISKKRYSGINVLLLELAAMKRNWTSKWFGTYRQVSSIGGHVKRRPPNVKEGEWGTKIVFFKPIIRKRINDDGEEERDQFFVLKEYSVFNADQVDGLDHLRTPSPSPFIDIQPAEELLMKSGAEIRFGGDRAFFHRFQDYIQMPFKQTFDSESAYYQTLFHELSHWTGPRLGRASDYAFEELVAEISASYVASELRIPQSDDLGNSTAYLAHWIKRLEGDHHAIFRASSLASKVADFLLAFREPIIEESEEQIAVGSV